MQLRFRDLREDNDIGQKEIASYLGCDTSLYSKYELGRRPLPLRHAIMLADYYRVNLDYLLGRTDIEAMLPPAAPDILEK